MKRIIVCDSGLGGLNIAAGFFAASAADKEKCEVVYFNAYPSPECGFNKLDSERAQEELFKEVLEGMKKFSPDLCLIACNTLSIIYERLKRWYTPAFAVTGIIDAAVAGMKEKLLAHPESSLLILGTKSTVESGVYARRLTDSGIDPRRIKGLGCPGLATLLESDPGAEAVAQEIAAYAEKAVKLFDTPPQKLFCALCCTHFGFASGIWEREFALNFANFAALIDPNKLLVPDFSAVSFEYCAKIDFFPGARESMSRYFAAVSPVIAGTLQRAVHDSELFKFNQRNM
jgi:glutamate racemase